MQWQGERRWQGAPAKPGMAGLRRAAWSSPAGWLVNDTPTTSPSDGSPADTPPLLTPPPEPQAKLRRRRATAAPLLRWLLLLGVTFVIMHRFLGTLLGSHRGVAGSDAGSGASADSSAAVDASAEVVTAGTRSFLKDGSIYQNDHMTLWNARKTAISVQLRIQTGDRFELLVEHLDSVDGGSAGWFSLSGHFLLQPLPGAGPDGQRFGVVTNFPSEGGGEEGFTYDEAILEPASRFVFRCLRRLGASGLLKAMHLEVDAAEDAVRVAPRSSLIRMLWDEEVALRKTSDESLWTPAKEGNEQPGGDPTKAEEPRGGRAKLAASIAGQMARLRRKSASLRR